MKRRSRPPPLARAVGRRDASPRILIVCEDAVSGRGYFLTLSKELRVHGVDVRGPDSGTAPISLVDYAIHLQQGANINRVPYDHLWCVIDGDRPDTLARAMDKAAKHGIKVAVSTPCIEVWFRLHFEYSPRPCGSSKNAVKRLREVLPDYEKGTDHGHEWRKRWSDALENGKRLARHHQGISGCGADPSTDVHLLVELLAQHRTDEPDPRLAQVPKSK